MMFREITRKRQALSLDECKELLKSEPRGVLSVHGDDGYPYGLPMNHYYCEENGHIYFHSGKQGHKIDAMRRCDKASFCLYDQGYVREGEWALNIKSVIVFGKLCEVKNVDEAMEICRNLSLKFTCDTDYIENEIKISGKNTLCFKLIPEYITGKIVNES